MVLEKDKLRIFTCCRGREGDKWKRFGSHRRREEEGEWKKSASQGWTETQWLNMAMERQFLKTVGNSFGERERENAHKEGDQIFIVLIVLPTNNSADYFFSFTYSFSFQQAVMWSSSR